MDWTPRATPPPLRDGEVHVWRVAIPDAEHLPGHWLDLLAAEEKARAASKRIPLDARRTLTSRACLRILLGRYLDVPPTTIAFTTTPEGKPRVAAPAAATSLEFNVSHSGAWVVIGFARALPIGVDLECHRALEFSELVTSCFSPAEQEAWSRLPREEHAAAFFSAWTRKEACLKALGLGLSKALDSFSVAIGHAAPSEFVGCSSDGAAPLRWLVVPIEFAPGYACAVATGPAAAALRTFTLDPSAAANREPARDPNADGRNAAWSVKGGSGSKIFP